MEIIDAIKIFSINYNPAKIKKGTKIKVVKTNKGKLLGFYLVFSKNECILVYLTPTGYESIKTKH